MSWNFWLNRKITFFDARRDPLPRQYLMFCLACLVGAAVNWTVSVGLCWAVDFFDQYKLLAALLEVVAGTPFNYLLSCRIFRPSRGA